jgi:uncharacterized protein with HEPN domain
MRPEDRDLALLWDMRKFALKAQKVVKRISFERLDRDPIRKLALERALEVMGDAARRVSGEFKERHPQINWRDIVGQRNVLAHDYGKINHQRLYDSTHRIVPLLLAELERILGEKEP